MDQSKICRGIAFVKTKHVLAIFDKEGWLKLLNNKGFLETTFHVTHHISNRNRKIAQPGLILFFLDGQH
jgi:hypothetical protein